MRSLCIIPVFNQAKELPRLIEKLRAPLPCDEVLFVDDGSTDGTARAARDAAERTVHSANLTIIEGAHLPPGWSGKLWAVEQGIERARELAPEFLLLTDADIAHDPRKAGDEPGLLDPENHLDGAMGIGGGHGYRLTHRHPSPQDEAMP